METGVVAVAILVLLIFGSLALLARQRPVSFSLPALRLSGASLPAGKATLARGERSGPDVADVGRPESPTIEAVAWPAAREALPDGDGDAAELAQFDGPPPVTSRFVERLESIEGRLDELRREIERQSAVIARVSAEVRAEAEVAEGRTTAALDRLRADLTAAISASAAERQSVRGERRAEVSADLYARLARLESALSAVTNPILLPGETYAPPAELPAEALVWENWNEVGERTFALADTYSAQRLHLSDETSATLEEFVTALRVLLTRSVYPNLQAHPDAAQQAMLHAALEQIATELPKMRQALDREYRG